MVKEEIVEGIKMGLTRGESLKQAMMTFYNAGYTKDEIEEAVHFMRSPQLPQTYQQPIQQPEQKPEKKPDSGKEIGQPLLSQVQHTPAKPVQIEQVLQTQQPPQPRYPAPRQPPSFQRLPQSQTRQAEVVQQFSGYGEKPSLFWTIITFVLTFLLLVLLGVLVAVWLFRDELADFLSGIL